MNDRELTWLSPEERQLPELPLRYLLKLLILKMRRRTWGRLADRDTRMSWTVTAVSDADGPAANVRNYLERQKLRDVLAKIAVAGRLRRACEVGCGYGRLIMVLQEFADEVTGFEREGHLLEIARSLLPDIRFVRVPALTEIEDLAEYDFAMTFTVLQHLVDAEARAVCHTLQQLAPGGYVLCAEKTEAISVTENTDDGRHFISRARTVAMYQEMMAPFQLVATTELVVEPTYHNPHPGTCMLFASPARWSASSDLEPNGRSAR